MWPIRFLSPRVDKGSATFGERKGEAVIRLSRVAFHVVAPAAVFGAAFYLGLMLVR
jgi:hypothetical protein